MTQLLDPKLEGKLDEDQVQRMVLAASLCINRTARLRPEMNQVLTSLISTLTCLRLHFEDYKCTFIV